MSERESDSVSSQIKLTLAERKKLITCLRIRLVIRLCCMFVFNLVIQFLLFFRKSGVSIIVFLLFLFILATVSSLVSYLTFWKVVTNKITFIRMSENRKIKFFDCKCDLGGDQVYYFKETKICKVILYLKKEETESTLR